MTDREKFPVQRFFTRYMQLVDVPLSKKNPAEYKRRLNEAWILTKDIDFERSILFSYPKDLAREIFLAGFARLSYYTSFRFMNVSDLLNIYFGHRLPGTNVTDEPDTASNIDIFEDALCLTLNYYEVNNKLSEEIILETVMSRARGRLNNITGGKRPKLNWLFFKGRDSELSRYKMVRNEFACEGNQHIMSYYNLSNPVNKRLVVVGDGVSGVFEYNPAGAGGDMSRVAIKTGSPETELDL